MISKTVLICWDSVHKMLVRCAQICYNSVHKMFVQCAQICWNSVYNMLEQCVQICWDSVHKMLVHMCVSWYRVMDKWNNTFSAPCTKPSTIHTWNIWIRLGTFTECAQCTDMYWIHFISIYQTDSLEKNTEKIHKIFLFTSPEWFLIWGLNQEISWTNCFGATAFGCIIILGTFTRIVLYLMHGGLVQCCVVVGENQRRPVDYLTTLQVCVCVSVHGAKRGYNYRQSSVEPLCQSHSFTATCCCESLLYLVN